MASADVSKEVLLLKLQLSDSTESKTVIETLNRLQELDITIDILAETGIGKAVNSFRKHEDAGEVAKSLVRSWKKLVPKETPNSQTEEGTASLGKRSTTEDDNQNSSRDECVKTDDPNKQNSNDVCSGTDDKDHVNPERELLNAEDEKRDGLTGERPQEEEKEGEGEREVEREADGEREQDDAKKPTEPKKGHFKCENVIQKNLKENLDELEEEEEMNVRGAVDSVKKHREDSENDNDDRSKGSEKSHKHRSRVSKVERQEKRDDGKRSGMKKRSKEPLPCSRPAAAETSTSEHDGNRTATDVDHFQVNKKAESLTCQRKKKREPSVRKQVCVKERETDEKHSKKTKDKKGSKITHEDKLTDKAAAKPPLSFESFLSYDLKTPKKRKISRDNKTPAKKFHTVEKMEESDTKPIKLPKASEDLSLPSADKGSVMDLLNVPLPAFLPECDEISHFQYLDRRAEEKVSEASVSLEAPIFTGQRLNTKMQVYSGAKITFLPAMMSLYQQCIRALQNNIDLLHEIGGVPFEILEPVLERCTPDKLLRIEECNPGYIGLTDHLWEKHCRRDFRDAQLEEYESWREMHLRLSEERENKLQRLTKSIASAHSGKPKGRQVKLAFIHVDAKPPRNVRIKQDVYGTSAAALQLPPPPDKPRARPSYVEPARPCPPSSGPSTGPPPDPSRKRRVAPMMAKSLKAFRKQLGRR